MPGLPREKRAARSPEPAQDSDDFRKPCGAADGLRGIPGGGGAAPSPAGRLGLVRCAARAGPRSHSLGSWRMQQRMDRTFTLKSRSPSCRPWFTRDTTSSGVMSPLCGERSRDGPGTKEGLTDSPGTGSEEGREEGRGEGEGRWRGKGGGKRTLPGEVPSPHQPTASEKTLREPAQALAHPLRLPWNCRHFQT